MKRLLRGTGITLLICAILLFMIAAFVQEQTKPMRVTTGIMVDGEFKATNSGYMGGNTKAQEDMGWLKGVSIILGLSGVCMAVGAKFVKEESPRY